MSKKATKCSVCGRAWGDDHRDVLPGGGEIMIEREYDTDNEGSSFWRPRYGVKMLVHFWPPDAQESTYTVVDRVYVAEAICGTIAPDVLRVPWQA